MLDEAHNLRAGRTADKDYEKAAMAALRLEARARICWTATPIREFATEKDEAGNMKFGVPIHQLSWREALEFKAIVPVEPKSDPPIQNVQRAARQAD